MSVHEHKEPDTLGGVLVLSQVLNWCGFFDVGKYKDIHQIVIVFSHKFLTLFDVQLFLIGRNFVDIYVIIFGI